jgi:Protein of unknown function (DUF964).
MNEILECVEKLNKILVDSDVYQNYLYAKKNLDTEDTKLLTEFKNLYAKFVEADKNFEYEKILSNMYSKLMLRENTRLFLQKELEMTQCMRQIYSGIAKNLDVELFD